MKLLHKTRKHSSRMRTALLQTICASVAKTRCCSWGVGGLCLKWTSLNRSPVLATRCQSGGDPQVWCWGGCTVSSKASWIMVTCAPPSGVHMCYRMTDRHDWKDYLPATPLAGGSDPNDSLRPIQVHNCMNAMVFFSIEYMEIAVTKNGCWQTLSFKTES